MTAVPAQPPAPASADAVPPQAPASPSPRTTPRLRGRAVAAIIVVAVLLVLSGLYLEGLLPFGPRTGSSGPPHGPVTFSQARAAGDALVHGYQGESWQLLGAGGLVIQTELQYPVPGSGATLLNCSLSPVSGVTQLQAPAYRGSTSSGASTLWALLYWGGGSGLVVSVVNGTAAIMATITANSTCRTIASALVPIPTTIADSSAVARAAAAAGGSAFLSTHPGANISFVVIPGISYLFYSFPPRWQVTYSTCTLAATASGTAPSFNATVNAAGVVTASGTGQTNCSGTPSLGSLSISGGVPFAHPLTSTGHSALGTAALRTRSPR